MIFKFKNKKLIKIVLMLEAVLIPGVLVFWMVLGTVWTPLDWRILDFFYAQAVQYGYGPPRSPQIVYVMITDDSYAQFGTRSVDRAEMARVNTALAQLGPAAVAYDFIFPLPSTPEADQRFADSLKQLGAVSGILRFSAVEFPTPLIVTYANICVSIRSNTSRLAPSLHMECSSTTSLSPRLRLLI
jgi:CHASE2 domain-containing sensor protein